MTARPDVMLVVDAETGLCVNAVVIGGDWRPPDGCVVVAPTGGAWIGWTLSPDGTWTPPPQDG